MHDIDAMFLKKEHQNKLLQDLKTVNDQHLSMGRNFGVYYYITSNHKEKKITKRWCQKIAKRPDIRDTRTKRKS